MRNCTTNQLARCSFLTGQCRVRQQCWVNPQVSGVPIANPNPTMSHLKLFKPHLRLS